VTHIGVLPEYLPANQGFDSYYEPKIEYFNVPVKNQIATRTGTAGSRQ
jgi:hypothetical protein